ncbi:hypothetical protein KDC22_32620 [Paenibacillus tritici]|uniref:hypothetical protein n=1 Tax=Paenibacillus tritici TaxID=1873425 RepID=UPI001BAE0FD5|nr:hypothetical protein [Paenibacillus tritici]QUL54925.1 hypothetical protein KDC22_32620 [Paenibacillus tritici]
MRLDENPMSLLKNKLIATLPIIVIAVIFLFSLAMIPSIHSAPHLLPNAIVNATGTQSANGNSPVLMLQPLWMACLIGNVIFLLVKNKQNYVNRKDRLRANIVQFLWGAIIALAAGFSLTWFAGRWGIHIPLFTDTALFLAIAYLAFFLMIAAVFSWIGLKGMIIFVLLLFFGAPVLSVAPELLPLFYRDWILPWLPMRFLVDGLRELLFLGQGLSMNHPTIVLIWIAFGSLLVLLSSSFKGSRKPEQKKESPR